MLIRDLEVLSFIRVVFLIEDLLKSSFTAIPTKDSGYATERGVYAVVDYYEPHESRYRWNFGALAELWSQKRDALPINTARRAEYLVPVRRIAGKFVPGRFRINLNADPPVNEPGLSPAQAASCQPLAVLRLPLRSVQDSSEY
jgi:hypothetical protein